MTQNLTETIPAIAFTDLTKTYAETVVLGWTGGYVLLKTVVFKKDGQPFTGLNPRLAPQGDAP